MLAAGECFEFVAGLHRVALISNSPTESAWSLECLQTSNY